VVDAVADGRNPAGLVGLVEVKTEGYLHSGPQIGRQLALARDLGVPYNLVVTPEATATAGLQRAVGRTGGQIVRFDPMTGLFSGY
jgi:hypothetical protein